MTSVAVGRVTRIALEATLLGALVFFVARAGAPGWGGAADAAAAARALGPGDPPGAPGATLLGALADLLPVGDAGFRVAVLSALAMVLALGGVIALARALVPDEPIAGVVAAAIATTAPVVQAGGELAGNGAIVAALLVWAAVHTVRARRGEPRTLAAIGLAAATIAIAPATGVLATIAVAAMLVRGRAPAIAAAGLVLVTLPVWWLVVHATGDPATWMTATFGHAGTRFGELTSEIGAGSAAPLLLVGLVGLGLGAATRLRGAGRLLVLVAAAMVGAALDSASGAATLLLIAPGLAVVAAGVARIVAKDPTRAARLAIGAAAAAPIALLAAIAPDGPDVDPGGDVPAAATRAILEPVPAGPGTVVLASPELYAAAVAEQTFAGVRPDLAIVPGRDDEATERFVLAELHAGRPVGADVDAFGRLDPRLAMPRGRGFQLLAQPPVGRLDPPAPASWDGDAGATLADALAMNRASYEAVGGHLDSAARAAGLVDSGRFDAGSLALLATARFSADRPPLYAYVPALGTPRWMRDVLGDDLAWVAGLDLPAADTLATPERKLHALWCEVLSGRRPADDPAIAALGPAAVAATGAMLHSVGRE